MRSMASGGPGTVTPELREGAANYVQSSDAYHKLEEVGAKYRALAELLSMPAGPMSAKDRLAQMNQLMDEIVDGLLDTPEPYRMPLLKDVAKTREKVRNMKLEE